MWKTCVLMLLALSVCALGIDRTAVKEKMVEYRIRSQNLHMDHLEHQMENLEHSFDSFSRPVTKWDVSMLTTRVRRAQGRKCTHREVTCGGDFPECVNHLFICDGIVDCHNGRDEDEQICESEIVHVGSTYQGVLDWDECENLPDNNVIITVTAVYHAQFFNPRVFVRATVVTDSQQFNDPHPISTIAMRGYYIFASRQLVLLPTADSQPGLHHPYGLMCSFHMGDNAHADCTINEVASLHQCAKFRIVKV